MWSLFPLLFALSCAAKSTFSQNSFAASQATTAIASTAHPAKLISEVLMRIQLDYVDPKRLEPQGMLEGALNELSRQVPEIQTTLKGNRKAPSLHLVVETQQETIPFQPIHQLNDLNNLLQRMTLSIQSYWSSSSNLQEVEYALIRGLLSKLDPHSVLLPKEIYSEFQVNTRGNFGGIGLMIGIRNNNMTVIAPIEGSPAARAGIREMDRIVRIGNESTANMNLTDTVDKLRGEKGTKLILYIMRAEFNEPKRFELTRELIQIDSVESTDLVENRHPIRYVKIKSFQESTDKDLAAKLKDLDQHQGLIIDLRNNPGGLLDQAIKVSDQFLPEKKVIVSTVGNRQNSSIYQSHWGLGDEKLLNLPIILLINSGSASASEILAAALKNNNRALLLGEQTFGKGSVQTIWQLLDESALKLTVAKYLTPGNKSIQSVGVTPDIELYPVIIANNRMQLIQQEESRERQLLHHFQGRDQPEKPVAFLPYIVPNQEPDGVGVQKSAQDVLKNDFFVRFAQKILIQHHDYPHQSLMETALEVQQKMGQSQDQQIVQELKKYDIDWKLIPSVEPPQLQVNIRIEQAKDGKNWVPTSPVILSGSQIRFHVTAKNVGKGAVNRLLALTKSEHAIFNHRELPLGYLAPGESKTRHFQVKLPQSMANSIHAIDFDFLDHQMKKWATDQIFLATKKGPHPRFEFRFALMDDGRLGSEGNGDRIIQAGEKISFQLKVKNIGTARAEKTLVLLQKDRIQPEILLSQSRVALGALSPQEEKAAVLLFKVKKRNDPANLSLSGNPEANAATGGFKLLIEIQNEALEGNNLLYRFDSNKTMIAEDTLFQAPEIDFEVKDGKNQIVKGVTFKKRVQLKGIARDDQQLKDVFVFLNQQKVFFQTNQGKTPAATLPFTTTLHLKEGHNLILVFARDQNNLTISHEIQLWHAKSPS